MAGPNGGPCVACAAGKYKAIQGTAACNQCVGGKYVSASASTSIDNCLACDVNTYSAVDSSKCEQCPSHSSSVAMSSVQTACICDPGYTGPNGGSCVACAGGKYKIVAGTVACTLCVGGKYSTTAGATSASTCLNCPLHTNAQSGSDQVEDCTCNTGHYGLNGRDCINCEAGKYKDVTGPDQCTLCAAGKYVSVEESVSSSACAACPAATYSSADRTHCLMCPSDSSSPTSSDEVADCTCNAGYTGPHGGPCTACVAGTYKPAAGSVACTLCGAGKYSTTVGALSVSTCLDCPAATYSSADRTHCVMCPSDSSSPILSDEVTDCVCNAAYTGPNGGPCTACVAGTYKPAAGSAACTLCGAGKYSTTVGALSVSTCLNCAEGKYSETVGASGEYLCAYCPAYSTCPEGSASATACRCNVGYSGSDGSACSACSQGTYKPVTGSSACSPCPIGMYNERTGTSVCDQCSTGATTLQVGSCSVFYCVCQPGYFGPAATFDSIGAEVAMPCEKCAKAMYKSAIGSHECGWCPVNTYADLLGATACLNCPTHSTNFRVGGLNRSEIRADCKCFPGYTSDGNTVFYCNACPAGAWKSIDGSAPCTSCEAGKYSTMVAAISEDVCRECPKQSNSPARSGAITNCTCNPGYTNPPGTNCSECSVGTYKPAQGAQSCTLCGQGKFSTKVGQVNETTCDPCPRGSLSVAFGAVDNTTCQPCPAGTYMPDQGATACLSCPLRSASPPGAHSISQCRCAPGYWGANGLPCDPCPAGTFKIDYGTGPCVGCPPLSQAPPGSDRATLCACFPGYTGLDENNGWACVMCSPSTYKNATSADPCTECPQNAISQPGSVSRDQCFCDVNYGSEGDGCAKCPVGKFKLDLGPGDCRFPAASAGSTSVNRTVAAELKVTGLSKAEFISSIDDFKKSVANSIIDEKDAKEFGWSGDNVIVIKVCVGSDCTVFVDEGRARRVSAEAISVSYKVSVPPGISPEALAQTMGDPATVKVFETKMSQSTGKPVGATYTTPPWVSAAIIEEIIYVPFPNTPVGIAVIAGASLLLFGCAMFVWLLVSIPRVFNLFWKKYRLKPLPPAHFSIFLQLDVDNFSDDILRSGLAQDLSTATGLKLPCIMIVRVAHQCVNAKETTNQGEACAVAEVHLIDCDESEIESLVLDLIAQSRDLHSSLMVGKWTKWTTRINDVIVNNGQVSGSYEIQSFTAVKKSAIKDFESLHAIKRWTRNSSLSQQGTSAFSGEIGPSLCERAAPNSTFLLSGFDFNHMTMDTHVFFDDPAPDTDQGLHAEKLRALLKEAESLTAGWRDDVPANGVGKHKVVEYEVNMEADAQGLALDLDAEMDPEPYAKCYRRITSILKAAVLKEEPSAIESTKPSFWGGFNFVKRSSTLENEDFHDRADSEETKRVSLDPVSWEGITKEREFRRMWEEVADQTADRVDESELDAIFHRLSDINLDRVDSQLVPMRASSSGPSEIRDLMKSLEDAYDFDGRERENEVEPEPYLPVRSMNVSLDMITNQEAEKEVALVEGAIHVIDEKEPTPHPSPGLQNQGGSGVIGEPLLIVPIITGPLSVSPNHEAEKELALVEGAIHVIDEKEPISHLWPRLKNQGSGDIGELLPTSDAGLRTSPSLHRDGASNSIDVASPACMLWPEGAVPIESPPDALRDGTLPPALTKAVAISEFGRAIGPARSVAPRPVEDSTPSVNFGGPVFWHRVLHLWDAPPEIPGSLHSSSAELDCKLTQVEHEFAGPVIPASRPITGVQEFGTTGTPFEVRHSAPTSAQNKVRFRDHPPTSQRSMRGAGPLTKRVSFSRPVTGGTKEGPARPAPSRPHTQGALRVAVPSRPHTQETSAVDVDWAIVSSRAVDRLGGGEAPGTPRTRREPPTVRFGDRDTLVLGSPRMRTAPQHTVAGSRDRERESRPGTGTAALIFAAKLKLENSAPCSLD